MSDDNFDFDKMNDEFNDLMISLEESAKMITPMFLAFRKQGLSTQEAAALTAAMVSQTVPQLPQQPQED